MLTKEEIKTYLKVKEEISILCEKWAKDNLRDWQYYRGYDIEEDSITINYAYNDFWNDSLEHDSSKITIEELLSYDA